MTFGDLFQWFTVWLSYCGLTGLVIWAFGGDLSAPGFTLGIFTLLSILWGVLVIRYIQDTKTPKP